MTHTPGRWGRNIRPASRYPIIFAGRNTHVARVITQGLSDEEAEANCDLIAAAPDLLAACRAALAALEASRGAPYGGAEVMLRSAIAKAVKAPA